MTDAILYKGDHGSRSTINQLAGDRNIGIRVSRELTHSPLNASNRPPF